MMQDLGQGLGADRPDAAAADDDDLVIVEEADERLRIELRRDDGNDEILEAALGVDRDDPVGRDALSPG